MSFRNKRKRKNTSILTNASKHLTDCDHFGAEIAETLKLLPRIVQMQLKIKILQLCAQHEEKKSETSPPEIGLSSDIEIATDSNDFQFVNVKQKEKEESQHQQEEQETQLKQDKQQPTVIEYLETNSSSGKSCNSKLLYLPNDKQLYVKNNDTSIGISYTCHSNGCNIRVLINDGVCYKKIDAIHDHADQEKDYLELKLLNEIKEKIITEKDKNIKSIFQKVMLTNKKIKLDYKVHQRDFQKLRE